MSMEKLKAFAGTKQGKLILGCSVILIICWSFMFIQFTGGFAALFPGEGRIKTLKQDIRKLRSQAAENRKKSARYDKQRKEYREKLVTYWNEERDGLADTVLRNVIQEAAKELEITLNALGSVRITRINSELYFAEVDNLSITAPYDVIIKFLSKLSENRPKLHWRRLDLRPEPIRHNARNNRSGNILQTTPATIRMRLNGAVRVVGYDGKLHVKMSEKKLPSAPLPGKTAEKTFKGKPEKVPVQNAEKIEAKKELSKQNGRKNTDSVKPVAGGVK